MTDNPKKKIAIVGLGLMGGSLALRLRALSSSIDIYGITRNKTTLDNAVKGGIITQGFLTLAELFAAGKEVDIVVIATPVGIIAKIISECEKFSQKEILVTDVGSVKEEIESWAKSQKFNKVKYVGSHPMAGSHDTGFIAANPGLYYNASCFVLTSGGLDEKYFKQICDFWAFVGLKILPITSKEHDEIVSKISHLPHIMAFLLVSSVASSNESSLAFAGSGFCDTTRVAQSDASVWKDIIIQNKGNILNDLNGLKENINNFINLLEQDNIKAIEDFIDETSKKRKKINR